MDVEQRDAIIDGLMSATLKSSSMQEQIYEASLFEYSKKKKLSSQQLAYCFNRNRGTIANHIKRTAVQIERGGPRPTGRQSLLSEEIMAELRQKIIADYNDHILCTYPILSEWLYYTYDIEITTDTLGAIIRRD